MTNKFERSKVDLVDMAALIEAGYTRNQLCEHFSVSKLTIYQLSGAWREQLQRNAYEFREKVKRLVSEGKTVEKLTKALSKKQQVAARAAALAEQRRRRFNEVAERYKAGETLAAIGDSLGISRERVRQMVAAVGVTRKDTKRHELSLLRKAEKVGGKKTNVFCERAGLTKEEWKYSVDAGLTVAYRQQKSSARTRGISFELTFKDWLQIWKDSGKIDQRGRSKDKYCMSRLNDQGPYAVGNVVIKTLAENSGEALTRKPTKRYQGIFHILKGRSRSWLARYGKKNIGWFETEEQAVAARKQFLSENGIPESRLGGGKGFSVRGKYFIAQCMGKSTSHKTKEEAIASYKQMALEALANRLNNKGEKYESAR